MPTEVYSSSVAIRRKIARRVLNQNTTATSSYMTNETSRETKPEKGTTYTKINSVKPVVKSITNGN